MKILAAVVLLSVCSLSNSFVLGFQNLFAGKGGEDRYCLSSRCSATPADFVMQAESGSKGFGKKAGGGKGESSAKKKSASASKPAVKQTGDYFDLLNSALEEGGQGSKGRKKVSDLLADDENKALATALEGKTSEGYESIFM